MQNLDRFKFRAWDKKNKKIHFGYPVIANGNVISFVSDNGEAFGIKIQPLILMQCTGLKDKNNNLIFEGDIVNRYDADFNEVVRWHPTMLRLELVGKPQNAKLPYCTGELHWDFDSEALSNTAITIIGNIYGNPELINF